MNKLEATLELRFWQKVDRHGEVARLPLTRCWRWTGSKNAQGYGKMRGGDGKLHQAHRIAYELFVGPIPKGLFACHVCDISDCVNPGHLFLGTHTDNMRDMVAKGRHSGPPPRPQRLPSAPQRLTRAINAGLRYYVARRQGRPYGPHPGSLPGTHIGEQRHASGPHCLA